MGLLINYKTGEQPNATFPATKINSIIYILNEGIMWAEIRIIILSLRT